MSAAKGSVSANWSPPWSDRHRVLASAGIDAAAKPDAPGVYVNGAKIASLGLRIRRGCSFHGLALNVDPDLTPLPISILVVTPDWP